MCRIDRSGIGLPLARMRVVDQRTAAGAEAGRVAAQVPDVLVAGDGPEARRALVHGVLVAQRASTSK